VSTGRPDPKDLGRHFLLAQVGLEMVAPLGLGIALDYYFHWTPWGAIGGALFGLVGGMAHLIALVSQRKEDGSSHSRRDTQ